MHYLVTGHTGFKGAWLTMMLTGRGHTVSGIALDPAPLSLFERGNIGERLEHDLRVDIRDAEATNRAVNAIAPDVVVHLAAQPLVRESYRDPRGTWESNLNGTYNVLEAVRTTPGVRAQLVITTDKVYRNVNQIWGYREGDPLGGADPYSASKAAADLLTQSWIASFGGDVPTAIARAGNVIGGGDVSPERLMVDLVEAFSSKHPVVLRYPDAVRPWQHVLDCLNGYLLLVDSLLDGSNGGEAFNFGPGSSSFVSVGDVARTVASVWGDGAEVVVQQNDALPEAGLLALDARKAELLLGWKDRLALPEALLWTVEWWKNVLGGAGAAELTESQIKAFEELGR